MPKNFLLRGAYWKDTPNPEPDGSRAGAPGRTRGHGGVSIYHRTWKSLNGRGMGRSGAHPGLDPAAQHLGHAPGLGHAAARRVRRLRVEDLADGPDAGLAQVGHEALEERA